VGLRQKVLKLSITNGTTLKTSMSKFFQKIFHENKSMGGNRCEGSLTSQECRQILGFMPTIAECCALQSQGEISAASTIVEWLGLPWHHDCQKNWDTLKCLYYVLKHADSASPVLDVGASSGSVILNWLSQMGYAELFACDIREPGVGSLSRYRERRIKFSLQDLTKTNYPECFFRAVTCISVIEHGVPLEAFCREQSRILRPGGLLLISTDYWPEHIDCSGIYPYGEDMGEMKIFQRGELEEFCRTAKKHDLLPCSNLNLDTDEKAVRWDRVDREYTFAFIALQKKT